MFRVLLFITLYASNVLASEYAWPIKSSRSLSATFCEYRDGHLHAGIDIKTWGEMEVPCIAISDGYIEGAMVGFGGYGRGLFVRLRDGNLAVYGHLERFPGKLEKLVSEEQLSSNNYPVRFKFEPDQFPVSTGQLLGYSGTSGTEHPHLHFEIRDSTNLVLNPQLFYDDIPDSRQPIIDEIMVFPAADRTKVNNSIFPVIIPAEQGEEVIHVTGPFTVAVNAHDRMNGTYNKYNIYRAGVLLNDSLAFEYEFKRFPHSHSDSVAAVYPGPRGNRGWRFMSLYERTGTYVSPFKRLPLANGVLDPAGISNLEIQVSDIAGNSHAHTFQVHPESLELWDVAVSDSMYKISRRYEPDQYERYQFYSGENQLIPTHQTLYRLHSTTWYLHKRATESGIQALGALGRPLRWIIPPASQDVSDLVARWIPWKDKYILQLQAQEKFIFPPSGQLHKPDGWAHTRFSQTGPLTAESEPLGRLDRVSADSLRLNFIDETYQTIELEPMLTLLPGDSVNLTLPDLNLDLKTVNASMDTAYLRFDTTLVEDDQGIIPGAHVEVYAPSPEQIYSVILYTSPDTSAAPSAFRRAKRNSWRLLAANTGTHRLSYRFSGSGSVFFMEDRSPPVIEIIQSDKQLRIGSRLAFRVIEDTKRVKYHSAVRTARLDGVEFFPDYNPLRHELSFHIPALLKPGVHEFSIEISDEVGNKRSFVHRFNLN